MLLTNPFRHIYLELWNALLENIINPILNEEMRGLNETSELIARLKKQCDDEYFYPFIHYRIKQSLEAYCEEKFFPKLKDLNGYELILHAYNSCVLDMDMKAMRILDVILELEQAYLKMNTSELDFPFIASMPRTVFRETVYRKFAVPLREAAYECFSSVLIIEKEILISDYLELLRFVGNNESSFFDEEWNIPAYSKLIEIMQDSFIVRRKPLQEFLECTENLIQSSRIVFQVSLGQYERSIKQALAEMRDERVFSNEAKEFKMMLDYGDGKTLTHIFSTFKEDTEFPKTVAQQALKAFFEVVQGKAPHNRTEDWLKQENICQRLFSQWLSLQNILKHEDKNEQTIHETLILPFLTVINNTFPDSEAMMRMLAEYSEQLFSRIYQCKREFNPEDITMIKGLLSLSSHLPSAVGFHDFFRFLVSKIFLEGTFAPLRIEELRTRKSFGDQTDTVPDILAMLDDVTTLPRYKREMSSTIKMFGKKHGKIGVNPKIIRRSRWCLETDIGLVLPRKLQLLSRTILDHLHLWHPMRCATIHSSAGKMTITANFWTFRGHHVRIKLSTAQGCVLKLFEHTAELPLGEVAKLVLSNCKKLSGFNAIVVIVKSMITENAILLKQPRSLEFQETDVIRLNEQFQPETKLITLSDPEYCDESPKSVQAALTSAFTKRHKLALEANVMRILKQEREIELHRLEEIVCSQLLTKYNISNVSFLDGIERLARDEYLIIDKNIARYID